MRVEDGVWRVEGHGVRVYWAEHGGRGGFGALLCLGWGLGFGVWGLGFELRVQGSGFRRGVPGQTPRPRTVVQGRSRI